MRKKILLILLVIATATYAQQEVAQDTTATTKNIVEKEKTCTEDGRKKYTCTNCRINGNKASKNAEIMIYLKMFRYLLRPKREKLEQKI